MDEQKLIEHLGWLIKSEVGKIILRRMEEFRRVGTGSNDDWFSEMCFCILTANSRAKLGIEIQKELGPSGFLSLPADGLAQKLKEKGHRFWNARAQFIVEARKFSNIKDTIQNFGDAEQAREWLVENVKGLGFKEASHFLRNVGMDDFAILDRHVLNLICEYEMICEVPHTLTRKKYLEIEEILRKPAQRLRLPLGEMDLYLWYMKTGEVLK